MTRFHVELSSPLAGAGNVLLPEAGGRLRGRPGHARSAAGHPRAHSRAHIVQVALGVKRFRFVGVTLPRDCASEAHFGADFYPLNLERIQGVYGGLTIFFKFFSPKDTISKGFFK